MLKVGKLTRFVTTSRLLSEWPSHRIARVQDKQRAGVYSQIARAVNLGERLLTTADCVAELEQADEWLTRAERLRRAVRETKAMNRAEGAAAIGALRRRVNMLVAEMFEGLSAWRTSPI